MPFVDASELPGGEPLPGWLGRFFHFDHLTFAYYEIAPDAAPLHQHSHAQEEVWNVVDGKLAITIAGVERVVAPGCAAIVPANTPLGTGSAPAARSSSTTRRVTKSAAFERLADGWRASSPHRPGVGRRARPGTRSTAQRHPPPPRQSGRAAAIS